MLINNLGLFWFIYAVACLPYALLVTAMLPRRLRRTRLYNFLFFYFISVAIFIVGPFIAFFLGLTLHYLKPRKKTHTIVNLASYPEYQHSPKKQDEQYGEGFGHKMVSDSQAPKVVRQKMLIALNRFGSSSVNKINTAMLSDEVDEIRLYAQSLLEKQERSISQMLKILNLSLLKSKNTATIAFYKKQIAYTWWEQVHRSLISFENLTTILNKIEKYALEALQFLPNDIELPLLLAKVALRAGHTADVLKWLQLAEKNGAPDYKIVTYFAEIAYYDKNYNQIPQLFQNKNLKGVIGLQPTASFWLEYD